MRATDAVETRGFLKLRLRLTGEHILGFTALGVGASEIISFRADRDDLRTATPPRCVTAF